MAALIIAALVVVLAAILNLITILMARRGEQRFPVFGEFVDAEGVRLHYVRKGAGRPVVFLHGSEGFLQDFTDTVLPHLSSNADCIAFDRPGHGYSDIPRGLADLQTQARLIHAALERLEIERPVLVGHSWGSALALCYVQMYPSDVAGLTLIAGYIYPGTKITSRLLRIPLLILIQIPRIPLVGSLIVSTFTPLVKGLLIKTSLSMAFHPAHVPAPYATKAGALWARSVQRVRVIADENATDEPILAAISTVYPRISVPVYLCAGEDDMILPVVDHSLRFHEKRPQSELILIPSAGHQLMCTHPEIVIDTVRRCICAADSAMASAEEAIAVSGEDRARDLIFRYGWNATSYQILNPGIAHWFSRDGHAVVGYVEKNRVRVVAGAPIAGEEELESVAAEFEEDAERAGCKVCWFACSDRLLAKLTRSTHGHITIGSQPIWRPDQWASIVQKNGSLRAQLNRARNKNVTIEEWAHETAFQNPELANILSEWIDSRAMPCLKFLTEPVSLGSLADRRVFVAIQEESVAAFLVCIPIPKRNGWLVEQIVRGNAAPNGCAELLVDAAIRTLASEGSEFLTLGLAPLSQRVRPNTQGRSTPFVNVLLLWVRAHGKRFYNFEGLDTFKAKFRPYAWEPLYAVSNEKRVSFRTLYAIAAAFSDEPPVVFIARTVVEAIKQELRWIRGGRSLGR